MDNKVNLAPLDGEYTFKIDGVIKIKYRNEIKLNICKITYEEYKDGQYQYIFEPYYDVLDALPSHLSQGIPGLNLEKRKKFYYRVNRIPSFIAERTMREDRENLKDELDKVCMKEYNPLEWLIRTETEYSGDNLIVERYRLPKKITRINYKDLMYGDELDSLEELSTGVDERGNQLLMLIGSGVVIDDKYLQINKNNRVGALQLLINQYHTARKDELDKNKEKHNLKERKRKKKIDDFVLEEVIKELELKIINESEAMYLLKIKTRETLQRKIREYKAQKKK